MTTATQDIFERVIARPVSTATGEHASLVHLAWSAPQQGQRLVQVYVDGQIVEVTADPMQREMWLLLDRSQARRIELLAVPPDEIHTPRPHLLSNWDPAVTSQATLHIVRDESLPVDTRLEVSIDNEPVDRGPMWPADEHRGGFGGLFGLGEFGRDALTGPGLGMGELGMGPLGSEGTAWRWSRGDLSPSPVGHDLAVTATDHTGRAVAVPVTVDDIRIDALPDAAATFTIDPNFTLNWTA